MLRIVNYSHPLNQEVIENIKIAYDVGDDVEIVNVPCQIDLDGDIKAQLDALVEQGRFADLIVPPALGWAAGYVIARLSYAVTDGMLPEPPQQLVLRRSDSAGWIYWTVI